MSAFFGARLRMSERALKRMRSSEEQADVSSQSEEETIRSL